MGICNKSWWVYESIGTNWITLDVNAENISYLDSFGVEHIPKDILKIH